MRYKNGYAVVGYSRGTLRLGTTGIVVAVARYRDALSLGISVEYYRNIHWLGTTGIFDTSILQGYSAIRRCSGWALQGYFGGARCREFLRLDISIKYFRNIH